MAEERERQTGNVSEVHHLLITITYSWKERGDITFFCPELFDSLMSDGASSK